jgi:hypothetical protein
VGWLAQGRVDAGDASDAGGEMTAELRELAV